MAQLGKVCVVALLACPLLCGQTVLSLSSATAAPGSTATLTLTLSSTVTPPAGVQWLLTYPSGSVTSIRAAASSALSAAGKSLNCGNTTAGYLCLAVGMNNATAVANGVAATISITLASSASGSIPVGLTGVTSVSSSGVSLGVAATGGSIMVSTPPASTGTTAIFQKTDATTAGTWNGVYGGDGYGVIGDTVRYPAYATVTTMGNLQAVWAASTTDLRALQKSSATDRIAACWDSSGTMLVDLVFSDSATHQVALYVLDWDRAGRSERIDIVDGATNLVLDTRSVSGFGGGQYLIWQMSGHVMIRVTNLNGSLNAVVSGLFFGGVSSASPATPPTTGTAAIFQKTDTTTAGTWNAVYGGDGYGVVGDTVRYPAYATVTTMGNLQAVWAASTTDLRALQKSSAADRIAACWDSSGTMLVDLAFSDSATHQVALYVLDWDRVGRSERIDIVDGATNLVLDTRSVSGFGGGQYLIWQMSGHVVIRVTNLNANLNAVVSGLFFGGGRFQ
jgi:hypothetical protein